MSWQSVTHILDYKPKIGQKMNFDFEELTILAKSSNTSTVVLGEVEAARELNLDKNDAGYCAFISYEDFKMTKALENEFKKLMKHYLKTANYEHERLVKAVNKQTKTCNGCKVNYPIELPCAVRMRVDRRIRELEDVFKIDINNTEIAPYQFEVTTVGASCPCCHKKDFVLTEPSIKKIAEMRDQLIEMKKTYFANRTAEANKQSKKKDVKIQYFVRGLIHESMVDDY